MTEPLKFTYIRDIVPGMKNLNCQFIVLDVPPPRKTKDGSDIRTIKIADKSGSVNFAVWNETGAALQSGDICRLINGFVSVHKLSLTVNCGKLGDLQKIGEFCMVFSEIPNMSTPNNEFAKFSDQQPKPSTGDNGGGGTGNGGTGGSGGGPPPKIPRTDCYSLNKTNGTGQTQSSMRNVVYGSTNNRKRKYILENPAAENSQQQHDANNQYSTFIEDTNYTAIVQKTQVQFTRDTSTKSSTCDSFSSYNMNNNNNCSKNFDVNNCFVKTGFASNAGFWFKPMSKPEAAGRECR